MQLLEEDLLTMDDARGDRRAREVERCALAVESLLASGRVRLQVHGESMLPTLWPGDLVEISSCSVDEVLPGEIVLALREGRFFLHRFLGRSQTNRFLLRGDSMPRPDPQFPNDALLGRLVSCGEQGLEMKGQKEKQNRVHPVLALRPWSWAIGQLLCFFGPARRLALRIHSCRKRNTRKVQGLNGAGLAMNDLGGIDIGVGERGAS
jgi:hypothetical protein